jgi:hypothetical protein
MANDQRRTRRPATRRTTAGGAAAKRTTGKSAAAKRTTPAKSAKRATPARTEPPARAGERPDGTPMIRWATMSIPVPVGVRAPHLHMPHVDVPGSAKTAAQQTARRTAHAADTVRASVQPPRRLVYYGALGVAAAVGVIEWPVAAAIGAGVWVASRARRGYRAAGAEGPTDRGR